MYKQAGLVRRKNKRKIIVIYIKTIVIIIFFLGEGGQGAVFSNIRRMVVQYLKEVGSRLKPEK